MPAACASFLTPSSQAGKPAGGVGAVQVVWASAGAAVAKNNSAATAERRMDQSRGLQDDSFMTGGVLLPRNDGADKPIA